MMSVVAYQYGWNFPNFVQKVGGHLENKHQGMFFFDLQGKNASYLDKTRKFLPQ